MTVLPVAFVLTLTLTAAPASVPRKQPNIVFIMADDLGFAELGCYGQTKIRTPNIDKLAAGGMKFTRFYAGNAVCAPSRCSLMTGKHQGHAAVRTNVQFKKGEEGQWPIPLEEVTIPELLKQRGYVTGAMGKWGLGNWDTTGSPLKQGFDHFFGYNCQAHAHSHYPKHLYRDGVRLELPGNDGKTGDTFTQDLFEQEAIKFLDANKAKPFFLYLPFIVPHVAVQVPDDSLNEYKGKLGDDPAYDGKKGYLPHPAPHAGYAAMVSRMDRSVGRIVDKLKQLKLDDNTLVIFTSDNGATHNAGGADSTFFESAGKLRGLKGSLYEGGIRVPFLASWPGTIKPGTTSDLPLYFPDVMPTLCDVAGLARPKGIDGLSFFATLHSLPGQQDKRDFLYWEFPSYGGQQAIQAGQWKAIRQNLSKGVIKTELYDLTADPSETTDVASQHVDVLAKLEILMKQQHTFNPDFPLPSVDSKQK